MSKLHEIRLRSDKFIANINDRIDEAIMLVDDEIVDLNRDQMKEKQQDTTDRNLPEYSSFNKAKKGLTYWNLFITGDFQGAMFLSVKYPSFSISSNDGKTGKILGLMASRIGASIQNAAQRLFGIAPSNQNKAKQITGTAFARYYKSFVFGK